MTTHIAVVARRLSGWKRMYARCSCGWASAPTDGRAEAEAERVAHLASVGATTEVQP